MALDEIPSDGRGTAGATAGIAVLIDRGAPPAIDVIREDALNAFRVMKSGGVAVLPLDVSYAIFGHTARAVARIYALKNRSATKPNGVIGSWDIFREVMMVDPRDRDLVSCIVNDYDLPLSVVAPFRADHDWLQRPSSVRYAAPPRPGRWIC